MKRAMLFAPPKILLQHSESQWISILGEDALIYSDLSAKEVLQERFPLLSATMALYENFNDSASVELDALAAAQENSIQTIIALAEVDLLRVARIKDRVLDCGSHHEKSVRLYRDKFLMKQRLAQHGIAISPMALIHSACDLHDFITQYGYPMVVKPRDGRGSGGVKVLRNNRDLHAYLGTQKGTSFYNNMVEKYLDAPLLNVNGLYIDGQPLIISPVRSTITCLEFLDGKSLGFYMLSAENPLRNRCIDLTRSIIEKSLPKLIP